MSQTVKLHQQALVYEAHLSVASMATSLASCSITPTLFAVGIELWYGAVEGTLKRLQPFSAMLNHSRPLGDSIMVENTNSPLIFGSVKASRYLDLIPAALWILKCSLLASQPCGTRTFELQCTR